MVTNSGGALKTRRVRRGQGDDEIDYSFKNRYFMFRIDSYSMLFTKDD